MYKYKYIHLIYSEFQLINHKFIYLYFHCDIDHWAQGLCPLVTGLDPQQDMTILRQLFVVHSPRQLDHACCIVNNKGVGDMRLDVEYGVPDLAVDPFV